MNNKEDFYKSFNPELSPKQMLEYGVFGGSYLGATIKEYPKNWFTQAYLNQANSGDTRGYLLGNVIRDKSKNLAFQIQHHFLVMYLLLHLQVALNMGH